MAREDVRLSNILTRKAFENAIRVMGAIGGSTNTVLHLLAIAGPARRTARAGGFRPADRRYSAVGRSAALGAFLMEDLHYAGGLPAVMKELAS